MTLIITFVNTGMDHEYIQRFLKAWTVSLPIAIGTALFVGPFAKKFVDKITKQNLCIVQLSGLCLLLDG